MVQRSSTLVHSSLASSTISSYNRVISDYAKFLKTLHADFAPFPPSPALIVFYITHLQSLGYVHPTIVSKISSLSFFYKFNSLPDPTSHFLVVKALKAVQKISASNDSRLPITLNIFHLMLDNLVHVSQNSYHLSMFKAMLSLSFFAFLRPGEITSSDNNISLDQIKIFPKFLTLTFTHFKHYQGEPITITVCRSFSRHCPVHLLSDYIVNRGMVSGHLFCHPTGHPVTYSQYNTMFSRLVRFLRLPGKFSPHSARIGAATYAASIGVSEEVIRRVGRWRSSSYLKYIRVSSFIIRDH